MKPFARWLLKSIALTLVLNTFAHADEFSVANSAIDKLQSQFTRYQKLSKISIQWTINNPQQLQLTNIQFNNGLATEFDLGE